jgi:hypothetical protein
MAQIVHIANLTLTDQPAYPQCPKVKARLVSFSLLFCASIAKPANTCFSYQGSETPNLGPAPAHDDKRAETPKLESEDLHDIDHALEQQFSASRCTPGTYTCTAFGDGVGVCGHDGRYTLAAWCCGDHTCFLDPTGVPHCNCGPRSRSLDTLSPLSPSTDGDRTDSLEPQFPNTTCNPGTYACTAPFSDGILVCGQDGTWQVSSMCCGVNTCDPTGVAHCKCNPQSRALDTDKDATHDKHALEPLLPDCVPGQFVCHTPQYDAILVCAADKQWKLSALCCGNNSCDPTNGAHCKCSPNPRSLFLNTDKDVTHSSPGPRSLQLGVGEDATDNHALEQRQIIGTGCTPAEYGCTAKFDAIWVCDLKGQKHIAALCRPGRCGVPRGGRTMYCIPPSSGPSDAQKDGDSMNSILAVADLDYEESCEPATYQCRRRYADALEVCGEDRKWKLAAKCCGVHTCQIPPLFGVPMCNCTSLDTFVPEEETPRIRQVDIRQVESENPDAVCTPGTFQCRQPYTYGQLQVCNSLGVWEISSNCCGPYTCVVEQNNIPAHCYCSPKPQTLETIVAPLTKSVGGPQSSAGIASTKV